jgi:pyridoxine/pyridoxamine 5'-phosphate oxidase
VKTLLDLSLVIYTDKELKKKDIQNNSEFSALFYDSKKLLQIRIEGKAELITDKEQITYWHTVQQASKRLYHKYCTWFQ